MPKIIEYTLGPIDWVFAGTRPQTGRAVLGRRGGSAASEWSQACHNALRPASANPYESD
jgi:hypothetical protein